MIKNTRQEQLVKQRLTDLLNDRHQLAENSDAGDIEKQYALNAFDGMINSLQEELNEYQFLKRGSRAILQAKTLEELPVLLIKARIAKRMSQSELARNLGVKPQQVQRYEAQEYQNISFSRLLEIAEILGVTCSFEKIVVVGTGPKFALPENLSENIVIIAEQRVKERFSLVI